MLQMKVNKYFKMVMLFNERLNILRSHRNRNYLSLLTLTGCVFYLVNVIFLKLSKAGK